MRFRIILVMFLLSFISSVNVCLAHAPDSIEAKFDDKKLQIPVRVHHPVSTVKGHYISKIILMKDGKVIDTKIFTEQADKDYQDCVFNVPGLKDGDEVKVEAYCNISGFKGLDIVIDEKTGK